ncbi:unnamed protein product, partial [Allacma fusca]
AHDYRKFAAAKEDMQIIPVRNIQAEIKMTEVEQSLLDQKPAFLPFKPLANSPAIDHIKVPQPLLTIWFPQFVENIRGDSERSQQFKTLSQDLLSSSLQRDSEGLNKTQNENCLLIQIG